MGLPIMLAEFSAKRLELLKDAMPRITRVAVLWDPPTAYHTTAIDGLKAAAPSMGIELSFIEVRTPEQIDSASSRSLVSRAEALHVLDCPLF